MIFGHGWYTSAMALTHRIKVVAPALKVMAELGFTADECLKGTELASADLLAPVHMFTQQQEFRFHRNLLELSGDPLLGLQTGRAYTPETYGLFGYAFMSAPTLRHALNITQNYGLLTFSQFAIDFKVSGRTACLRLSRNQSLPEDLLPYYEDRDLTAAVFGGEGTLAKPMAIQRLQIMHSGQGRQQDYRRHYVCDIEFDTPSSAIQFQAELLDEPMPLADAETSNLCQQQCQLVLARLGKQGNMVEQVRQIIVARPGYFPDIDYVAEKLELTGRTLRRRLAAEDSSYQLILADVRSSLAREYLASSSLPLEEISVLLGYSAATNFSNAFKRWHGCSPRDYRRRSSQP